MKSVLLLTTFAFLTLLVAAAPIPRPDFSIKSEHLPHVSIEWPREDGSVVKLEADREYLAPNDKTPLGKNISCYVALGGNRGDYGLGRPNAVDLRVGFYKNEKGKLFFEGLADDAAITVVLSGIEFSQAARGEAETMMQHLKYEDPNDVLGCAGDPELLATWNTYSKEETLAGRLNKRNSRPGSLGADNTTGAKVTFETGEDGRVTMTAVIPYALFKHADDPWLRSGPGDFVEPVHFHLEFEAVEKSAAPYVAPVKEE